MEVNNGYLSLPRIAGATQSSRSSMSIEAEARDGGASFLPKPGSKSATWQYFGLKADRNGKPIDNGPVFCEICRHSVMTKSRNTLYVEPDGSPAKQSQASSCATQNLTVEATQ